ncbi:MAG: helix-turn-helix transcriptional regulator [Clostridia bacterium]|nr:helix-turn-helix transcriptional regulator [Clostridia bacterium]
MQLEAKIDFVKIGQRIKTARLEKGFSQAELGALLGCSNNHMSHVEVGQTKVSLTMLVRLAAILEKDFEYFLLDSPSVKNSSIIDGDLSEKLKQCDSMTLITLNKIIDALLEQQRLSKDQQTT